LHKKTCDVIIIIKLKEALATDSLLC